MKTLLRLVTAAAALAFWGCASPGPYYDNSDKTKPRVTSWKDAHSIIPRGTHETVDKKDVVHDYDLAFVEFGEEGSYEDKSQVDFARQLIESKKHLFLFVYLHGWHHNAKPDDNDLRHFKNTLNLLAGELGPKHQVVGVYMGWQGETLKGPWGLNSVLTYYGRKSAAERLADNLHCQHAIGQLVATAHAKGTHPLVVGHSFGGLVLERAVKSSLVDPAAGGENVILRDSLIVVLNPATESILTRQIQDNFVTLLQYHDAEGAYFKRSPKERVSAGNAPYIVSITSDNDMATKDLFRVASWLWRKFHWFRGMQDVPVPPNEEEILGNTPAKVHEGEFFEHTPGHETRLVNYRAVPEAAVPAGNDDGFKTNLRAPYDPRHPSFVTTAPIEPQGEGIGQHPVNSPKDRKKWGINYVQNAHTPYWIVRVPPVIINNHGGIWSNNSVAMIAAIYAMKFPAPLGHKAAVPPPSIKLQDIPTPTIMLNRQLNTM